MIPVELKLRNFLSYGAAVQTINFEPFRLICLSGKNGHGKSALLDAMTWVLWGQARKTSGTAKADEGLLRLGQHHMMVSFDFWCNQKKYRVQREFVIMNGRSSTELHFGIVQDDGTCAGLTEKTIRATQQKIIDVIGLDYEACINSIFLRQGQSNEFSQKSPKERKEVLANILNMHHYELLKVKAQEKAREHAQNAGQLKPLIDHLKQEIAQKTLLTTDHLHLQESFAIHEKQVKNLQTGIYELRNQEKIIREELHKKEFLEQAQKTILTKYHDLAALFNAERLALRLLEREQRTALTLTREQQIVLIARAQEYEKIRVDRVVLKDKIAAAHLAHAHLTQTLLTHYHEERARLTAGVHKKEQEYALIKHEHDALEQNITMLQASIATLEQKRAQAHAPVAQWQEQLLIEEKKLERKKQFYLLFGARFNALNQSLKELEHKISLCSDAHNAACPLCEQILSSSRKKLLHIKLASDHRLFLHQKKRLSELLPRLKQQLIDKHAALTNEKQCYAQAVAQEQECVTLTRSLKEKKEIAITTSERHKIALSELEKARAETLECTEKSFFVQHQAHIASQQELSHLEKCFAEMVYDAQEHEQIQTLLKRVNQENPEQMHHEYSVKKEQHKKIISLQLRELRALKKEMLTLAEKISQHHDTVQRLNVCTSQLANNEQELAGLLQASTLLLQKKGALEQQLVALEQKEKELAENEKKADEQFVLSEDYQLLAQALGKNGIQALLIENAIPELEHEANALLSRLTENQSHIIIESVRDLKGGGLKETLDINISDAVGTRPYELFSGGEAFRIDFALRIAISKLLARRAGTSLQTLIIDEGFGSQDEEGLARIMDALYKIQDDFAKIIIVSHLPEMKNQFPTHFFVQKHSSGSQVTVFEQG